MGDFPSLAAVGLVALLIGASAPGARAGGFEPTLALPSVSAVADSPTGMGVLLDLSPEHESGAVELRRAVLTLPRGLSLDPSALPSLAGCSPTQLGLTSAVGVTPPAFDAEPAHCPAASDLGSVEIQSPLVAQPLLGAAYLGAQGANPFASLLAVYVAIEEPHAGIRLKLAGRVALDPQSGQLTIVFDNIPRLPVETLRLVLPGGSGALLTTPSTCGSFPVEAQLTPWEGAEMRLLSHFAIGEGAGGSACPGSEADEPNHPDFEAGTVDPAAGTDSPFFLRLRREAGSQPLAGFDLTLPPGLLGHLGGIADLQRLGDSSGAGAGRRRRRRRRGGVAVLLALLAARRDHRRQRLRGAARRPRSRLPGRALPGSAIVGGGDHAGDRRPPRPRRRRRPSRHLREPDHCPDRARDQHDPHDHPRHPARHPLDRGRVGPRRLYAQPDQMRPLASDGTATSVLGQLAPISSPFQAGGCAALPFEPKLRLRLEGGRSATASPPSPPL